MDAFMSAYLYIFTYNLLLWLLVFTNKAKNQEHILTIFLVFS